MYRFSHILYAPSRILRAPLARALLPAHTPKPNIQTLKPPSNTNTPRAINDDSCVVRALRDAFRPPTRARSTSTVAMGITFAKLFQRLFSKKEMRILMVRRPRLDATPRPRHGRNHRLERDGWDRREIAIWRR